MTEKAASFYFSRRPLFLFNSKTIPKQKQNKTNINIKVKENININKKVEVNTHIILFFGVCATIVFINYFLRGSEWAKGKHLKAL
jgi:hypothetical protein